MVRMMRRQRRALMTVTPIGEPLTVPNYPREEIVMSDDDVAHIRGLIATQQWLARHEPSLMILANSTWCAP
jgi:hypothetical protein